ncbi:MAG: methyltransferase domain-containing protein [Acidobacteria bacterium]|nr:methyltransferase domain-containing protein [Acidobacteriota bacterium]
MVAAARQKFPEMTFQVLEHPPHLPIPNESVDAVLLLGVLTCVPSDGGQRRIIAELHRVLRAGGLSYIGNFWLQTDMRNIQRYELDQAKYGVYGICDLPEGVTLRHHSRQWIERLTDQFDQVAVEDIEVITMNGHPALAFQWFARKTSWI